MDWFEVAEHGGNVKCGLEKIRANRVLVIGVETDILFPLWQQQELADSLKQLGLDTRLEVIPSLQGHDAFLVDKEHFGPILRDFLKHP